MQASKLRKVCLKFINAIIDDLAAHAQIKVGQTTAMLGYVHQARVRNTVTSRKIQELESMKLC